MFTTASSCPKVSTAWFTRFEAPAHVEMLSVFATALPPAAVISSTTSCAGPASEPEPSLAPPRSLTTTEAPSLAKSRACSRPMPRPAPVMTATRPSSCPMMYFPLLMRCLRR
ncbi:Uncharacterised protein [Mycobacteroides abscessus subsp. abscessus]|nr:Uncharacterised protein [Mycobacteroides abscessus subsp. abscessus]